MNFYSKLKKQREEKELKALNDFYSQLDASTKKFEEELAKVFEKSEKERFHGPYARPGHPNALVVDHLGCLPPQWVGEVSDESYLNMPVLKIMPDFDLEPKPRFKWDPPWVKWTILVIAVGGIALAIGLQIKAC
jgi:hypothetical protein